MKNVSRLFLLLVLCVSLFAIGCKKAAEPVVTEDTTMTEDIATPVTTEAVPTDTVPVEAVATATETATV